MHLRIFEMLAPAEYKSVPVGNLSENLRDAVSIQLYLQRTFNILAGSMVTRTNYGLPDFPAIHTTIPANISEYAKIIEELILKFEPAVKIVDFLEWNIEEKQPVLFCIMLLELKDARKYRYKLSFLDTGRYAIGIL